MKYKGTYRLKAAIDQSTNDYPRDDSGGIDPSFDDIYIKCYGDAQKYIEKIAIFPLLESNGRWNGQEYLQIYPCIQKKDYGDYFYVVYPNGDSISLVDWLKK